MNKLNIALAVSLIGITSIAQAGNHGRGPMGDNYQDWARVTQVQPQYERVNVPVQQCRMEVVYDQGGYGGYGGGDRSLGGAIIGGVVGGVAGNQVGKGNGRAAATAVGAVVGALVGDRIDNNGYRTAQHVPQGREVQRCYSVDQWENRLTGYHVTYEYNGRRYTRFMTERPGNRMRVNVAVTPA